MKTYMRREIKTKCKFLDLVGDCIWAKMLIIQLVVRLDGVYIML